MSCPPVRTSFPTSSSLVSGARKRSTSSNFAKLPPSLMPFGELRLPQFSAHFSTAFSPPSNPQSCRYCPRPLPTTTRGASSTNTATSSPSSTPHRHPNASVSPRPAPVARRDALGPLKLATLAVNPGSLRRATAGRAAMCGRSTVTTRPVCAVPASWAGFNRWVEPMREALGRKRPTHCSSVYSISIFISELNF
jgi:hypothetical protein